MKQAHQLHSTAAQLMAQARADTGIGIADTDIVERLEKYVHALNTEAQLHEAGAAAMEWHMRCALRNRLRLLRDLRAHPEILEQPIARPLIITGSARTGSTKVQKMLAAGGDFNFLRCWHALSFALHSGDRDEDPAARIRETEEHVGWFNEHAPKARLIHEFSTFEPEEEGLVLIQNMFAPYLFAFALTPGFIQWYMTTSDPHDDLGFLKRVLQYLQWQFRYPAGRRWMLKNPAYLGMEGVVADVFPDADFVVTHRDPVSTISSGLSLLTEYYSAYSAADHLPVLAPMLIEGQAMGLEQQIATRDARPGMHFVDLAYREVAADAEAAVEQVYAHAGMVLGNEARQRMRDWERVNVQHKQGVHCHAPQDFGVMPEQVRQRMNHYIARRGEYL